MEMHRKLRKLLTVRCGIANYSLVFLLVMLRLSTAASAQASNFPQLDSMVTGYWELTEVIADDSVYKFNSEESRTEFYRITDVVAIPCSRCLPRDTPKASFSFKPLMYVRDPISDSLRLKVSVCGPWIVVLDTLDERRFRVYHIGDSGDFEMTMTVKHDTIVFEGTEGPWSAHRKSVQSYRRIQLPPSVLRQIEH